MRCIVTDTGPLLHLGEAGLLRLVDRMGRIVTTPKVVAEWLKYDPQAPLDWLTVESVVLEAGDGGSSALPPDVAPLDFYSAISDILSFGGDGR